MNRQSDSLWNEFGHTDPAKDEPPVPEGPTETPIGGILPVLQVPDHVDDARMLGQYRLIAEVGRGGMGQVYRAVHTVMDRIVAVKVISPELVANPGALEWFRREVRAVTQLHHPNIVMAFDANEVDGVHFLVMEFVDGVGLDGLIRKNGPLPIPFAREVIRQSAVALQYAHEKGMVHRDIKPGNILITRPDGSRYDGTLDGPITIKVVDFGLARLNRTRDVTIAAGADGFLGTPDYVAPEQARDVHMADIRSDLYSLGCTLYCALTGRPPFAGETAVEKLLKHMLDTPTAVTQFRPEIDADTSLILDRLLAKEPDDRYQTPGELVEALEAESRPGVGRGVIVSTELTLPPIPSDFDESRAESIPEVRPAPPKPPAPPTPVPPKTVDPTLQRAWSRWVEIVRAYASGKGRSLRLAPAGYRRLQTALLALIRSQLYAEKDAGRRMWWQKVEDLVTPWLEPESLARTDPQLLKALLERADTVGRQLGVEPPNGSFGRLALLVVAAGPALMVVAGWLATTKLVRLPGWLASITDMMTARPEYMVLAAIPVVLALVAWITGRR